MVLRYKFVVNLHMILYDSNMILYQIGKKLFTGSVATICEKGRR